jgi:hypothetical protein
MNKSKKLTPKQNKVVNIVGLSLIPLVAWMIYDLNEIHQTSEKYGGEFVRYGWIEEGTSCNRLSLRIAMKEGGLFTPSTHIPALQEWQEKMNCNNPNSEYWRDSDYPYDDYNFGTNLQGEQIEFVKWEEWVKLQGDETTKEGEGNSK